MLFSNPVNGPAETVITELRDYPEWHRGRQRYGVWVAFVDEQRLLDYLAEMRRELADLLHPNPYRQAHLTVFVCGFESARRTTDDDFLSAQLDAQAAQLVHGCNAACTLPLGRPDSFASAAILPVDDPHGLLARWREALTGAAREVRQTEYCAHITLGLYRRRVDAMTLRRRLARLAPPPVPLAVRELCYATYRAQELFGPLTPHQRVPLA